MARDPLNSEWSGRVVTQARSIVQGWMVDAERRGEPYSCGQCGEPVVHTEPWVVGHIRSRALHPELTMVMSNWWPEHRKCSDASGQAAVIEKAKAEARAEMADSSHRVGRGETPPLSSSLPEGTDEPAQMSLPGIVVLGQEPADQAIEIRDDLAWDPDVVRSFPWLAEFADVPPDATAPLWMTPPADDATGSYGPEAIEWMEAERGIVLRWWQRLAITRQLEHRLDGTLCCETYIESAPRRAGKSIRMQGIATWRLVDPMGLFDETQLVMHTGNDLAICREVQMKAWPWAVAKWGKDAVVKANGKEAVVTPDGDRWLTKAQTAVYGYDICLGMVDEAWDVSTECVGDGIEPAMLERIMPQLMLTSTAHPRTTSLMPAYIRDGMTSSDPRTILLVWGVDPGRLAGLSPQQRAELIGDPALWKAASPHWSEDRARYIAGKWAKALTTKPTPDNPDPVRTFEKQYLNVWTLDIDTSIPGDPITEPAKWGRLASSVPADVAPAGAAIESWGADGISLALAYPLDERRVVVTVSDHDTMAGAVAAVKAARFRKRLTVGASLIDDPALTGVAKEPGKGMTGASVGALGGLLREDVVRHDGGQHFTDQVLEVRTVAGSNGARLVSKGRADAVKAAVWAITAARPAGPRKRKKMVTLGSS
jgi:hypothetical protein